VLASAKQYFSPRFVDLVAIIKDHVIIAAFAFLTDVNVHKSIAGCIVFACSGLIIAMLIRSSTIL
jgi:hypothetical protein